MAHTLIVKQITVARILFRELEIIPILGGFLRHLIEKLAVNVKFAIML